MPAMLENLIFLLVPVGAVLTVIHAIVAAVLAPEGSWSVRKSPRIWPWRSFLLLSVICLVFSAFGSIAYKIGGCSGGFKDRAICTEMSSGLGQFFHEMYFSHFLYGLIMMPLLFAILIVIEFLTRLELRRKEKRASTG